MASDDGGTQCGHQVASTVEILLGRMLRQETTEIFICFNLYRLFYALIENNRMLVIRCLSAANRHRVVISDQLPLDPFYSALVARCSER